MLKKLTSIATIVVLLAGSSLFALPALSPGDVLLTVRTDTTPVTGYGNASNEDILNLHPTSWTGGTIDGGTWSLYFDGTPWMASTQGIDALHVFADGSFICSTLDPATVPYPGPGSVNYDDIDLIHYDADTDTWSPGWDGSDHGLTSGMNVMACAVYGDSLILSTWNGGTLGGVTFEANDLVAFTPNIPDDWDGAGTWSLFLDGSDIGLDAAVERIDGLHILGDDMINGGPNNHLAVGGEIDGNENGYRYPVVLFSVDTIGGQLNAAAGGLTFNDEDIVAFVPVSLGDNTTGSAHVWMDGTAVGLGGSLNSETNAFSVFPIPEPMTMLLLGTGALTIIGWNRRRRLS